MTTTKRRQWLQRRRKKGKNKVERFCRKRCENVVYLVHVQLLFEVLDERDIEVIDLVHDSVHAWTTREIGELSGVMYWVHDFNALLCNRSRIWSSRRWSTHLEYPIFYDPLFRSLFLKLFLKIILKGKIREREMVCEWDWIIR